MKKILSLSLMLFLLAAVASAQRGPGDRTRNYRVRSNFGNEQITRPEKFELRKDEYRYKRARRDARRDGRMSSFERRRLRKFKYYAHRDAFRFRHNDRRRVI